MPEQNPRLIVPKTPPKDDTLLGMRSQMTHKDYFAALSYVGLQQGVFTEKELKMWIKAWQKLKLKPGQMLDQFERIIKARAIALERKIYWDYVNRRSNEAADHKLINDAVNAKGKPH